MITMQRVALGALNIGQSESAGQIGILAKVLFYTAPSRLAGQIEHGPQDHVHASRAHLGRDGCAGAPGKIGVPGSSEVDGRGEYGAIAISVQSFFNEDRRDSESRVFDRPLLDFVR